jgi:glycosyltransferase involved in cell wall biosynthesis
MLNTFNRQPRSLKGATRPRVLHVLRESFPVPGGYSIRSYYVLKHLLSFCDPVAITATFVKPRQQLSQGRSCVIGGVKHYFPYSRLYTRSESLPFLPHSGVFTVPWNMNVFEHKLVQLIRQLQPDIIHAHSPFYTAWPALKVAKKLKLPFIYEVRQLQEYNVQQSGNVFGYKVRKQMECKLLKKSDLIIAISEGLKKEILARGICNSSKIYLAPNGVDERVFNPVPRDQELVDRYRLHNCLVIGYVGTFSQYEGLDDLVHAFSRVSELYPSKLLLVGDGPFKSSVAKLIRGLPDQDKVILTGNVGHESITRYYSLLDVFVLPRRRQTTTQLVTPLKPLEAMAMRIPIVVSDVSGLLELVEDQVTGTVFHAEDIDDLTRKMTIMIENEEYRRSLAINAQAWVLSNRTWNGVSQIYSRIYNAIMNVP